MGKKDYLRDYFSNPCPDVHNVYTDVHNVYKSNFKPCPEDCLKKIEEALARELAKKKNKA
jgi:hypothetical protein